MIILKIFIEDTSLEMEVWQQSFLYYYFHIFHRIFFFNIFIQNLILIGIVFISVIFIEDNFFEINPYFRLVIIFFTSLFFVNYLNNSHFFSFPTLDFLPYDIGSKIIFNYFFIVLL